MEITGTNKKFSLKGTQVSLHQLISLQYIANSLPALPKATVVSNQFGGHTSKLKGRGIEFEEVRVYQSGDDIRKMDWKITARTGTPHTKLFQDEKERPVYLLIDDRVSMQFGTRIAFKSVIAAQIASILAWATVKNGDRLGAVIADGFDSVELKPYMRKAGVLPLLKKLSDSGKKHGDGTLVSSLIRLRHVINPGSLIFIISDFYNLGEDFEKHLSRIKMHNEIVGCYVYDPLEKEPPPPEIYQISDGENYFTIDTGNKKFCLAYKDLFHQRYNNIINIFNKWNIPMIEFATDDMVSKILLSSLIEKGF